jgi:6-pyruvoyltetrahydropterin/6-carboxytetrahydropterin synthase
VRIYKDIVFEAAHRLPNVAPSHRCYNLHGHTFRCRVECEGPLEPRLGWVVDFADVDAAVGPVVREIDHKYLNEVPGLENPTSEVIAAWLLARLRGTGLPVRSVTVSENDSSGAIAE